MNKLIVEQEQCLCCRLKVDAGISQRETGTGTLAQTQAQAQTQTQTQTQTQAQSQTQTQTQAQTQTQTQTRTQTRTERDTHTDLIEGIKMVKSTVDKDILRHLELLPQNFLQKPKKN